MTEKDVVFSHVFHFSREKFKVRRLPQGLEKNFFFGQRGPGNTYYLNLGFKLTPPFKLSVVRGTQVRDEYTMFNHRSVFFFHFPKTFQPMRTRQLIKYKLSKYKIL